MTECKGHYFEVCIALDSAEFSEIFTSEIMDFCGEAVEITDNKIIVRTSKDMDFINALLSHLSDFSANLSQINSAHINFTHSIEKKQNRDWIEEYKSAIKPIRCGRFYICPPWLVGNSSLGIHSADFGFFGISQTPSLVSIPKNPKNYESNTANTSIVIRNANQSAKNPSLRGSGEARALQSTPNRHTERSEVSKTRESSKNSELMIEKEINESDSHLQHYNSSDFASSDLDSSLVALAQNDKSNIDCFGNKSPRNDENIAVSKATNNSAEVSLDNFVGFQARKHEIGLDVHRVLECAESRESAKETIAQTINIILEPSLAFGTGHHASTFMCIEALESLSANSGLQNKTLLDFGCGSGILALCANKLGAKVDLCDIDELAIDESKKNFYRNNATISHIWQGGIRRESKGDTQDSSQKYDIITANIIASVLIEQKENIDFILKCGGIAILSGILDIYKDEVLARFSDFTPLKIAQKDEWICIMLRKF